MNTHDSDDRGRAETPPAAPNGRSRRRLLAVARPPQPWHELTEMEKREWSEWFVELLKSRIAERP
jgi:hypothetical protein